MSQTWHIPCGPASLHLGARTYIMGILNVTPDSFSDGGTYLDLAAAVAHAKAMLADGADIIDVGGESTRPHSQPVGAEEEQRRVIPVIQALRQAIPHVVISIDSYKAVVADAALQAGANILNDVWGLQRDPQMATVAAKYQAPTIVMHNQESTTYQNFLPDVIASLQRSIDIAVKAGLPKELVIIDPGIGFGKTIAHNLDLLRDLEKLGVLGCPLLLGFSRKSTIGKVLGDLPPHERMEGTAATVALGIVGGAAIVRVHDVKAMKRVAQMTDAVMRPNRGGFVIE